MTEQQLNRLGFVITGNTRVFHPLTEIEFKIKSLKMMDEKSIVTMFGERMFRQGESYGKVLKTEEIKKALNL